MELRLSLGLECTVCLRNRNQQEVDDNITAITLLGVVDDPYAVCPSCKKEMYGEEREDVEFQRRVRLYYFQRGIVCRQDDGGRWQKRTL